VRAFLGLAGLAWHFLPRSGLAGGEGFSNGDFARKARSVCGVTSLFIGMRALLPESAVGFGLQRAPVALLCEAFARWPPSSSPSKRSALR
jgi:hypothetical protein